MIIYGARDAGPAEYIARVINHLNEPYLCIASSISEPVFMRHGVECESVLPMDIKPDLIVTGTCLGAGIDKTLVKFGIKHGISTISIIEHWTWMLERFEIDGNIELPDIILVNDEIAKQKAVIAGIPQKKIAVVGNPVLEEKPDNDHVNIGVGQHNKSPDSITTIVFVSEELSSAFPKNCSNYMGFDEFDVLIDIIHALSNRHHLIIKMHPEEDTEKYVSIVKQASCKVSLIKQCDIQELINSADVVIGMGSMLLLEAARTRTDIISYRPNETTPFVGNELGVTYLVTCIEDLSSVISGQKHVINSLIGDQFKGSLNCIVKFIENSLLKRKKKCVS